MDKEVQNQLDSITAVIVNSVPVDKIYLFGSYAYGQPSSESDYDFFVVLPDDSLLLLEAKRRIYKKLAESRMSRSIDIVATYSSRFKEKSKLPTLEQIIAQKGILLYEHDEPRHSNTMA